MKPTTIVDFRINGTLQTGAVENRTYRGGRKCSFIFRIHYKQILTSEHGQIQTEILPIVSTAFKTVYLLPPPNLQTMPLPHRILNQHLPHSV